MPVIAAGLYCWLICECLSLRLWLFLFMMLMQDGTKSSEEIGGKDRSHVASKSKDDGSTKIWMSALCSVGVIAVIFTYVSLDFHVNDVDIP